eukprot:GHVP01060642.1.p2 GENE.GHVP01060642.1~~GHVP01060642.1.p2  ORF type:complete len:330 (+),score=69.55 GHVP01060642.1:1065-2054(+)
MWNIAPLYQTPYQAWIPSAWPVMFSKYGHPLFPDTKFLENLQKHKDPPKIEKIQPKICVPSKKRADLAEIVPGVFVSCEISSLERRFFLGNKITKIVLTCGLEQINSGINNFGEEDIFRLSWDYLDNLESCKDLNEENCSPIFIVDPSLVKRVSDFCKSATKNSESVIFAGGSTVTPAAVLIVAFLSLRFRWHTAKSIQLVEQKLPAFEFPTQSKKAINAFQRSLEHFFGQEVPLGRDWNSSAKSREKNIKKNTSQVEDEELLVSNTFLNSLNSNSTICQKICPPKIADVFLRLSQEPTPRSRDNRARIRSSSSIPKSINKKKKPGWRF